jgi:putative transposase
MGFVVASVNLFNLLLCGVTDMAMISFSGRHFKQELILQSVRCYLAYALSCRDIEEMMQQRGILVDHSTIHSWVIHYAPQLDKEFRIKNRKPCGR